MCLLFIFLEITCPAPESGMNTEDVHVNSLKYLDFVLTRLTVIGAAYLSIVCILPEFLIAQYKVPFYFGGTSLLIIVVVTMDLISQVQSHLMSRQYESILKKSSLTGPQGMR